MTQFFRKDYFWKKLGYYIPKISLEERNKELAKII